MCRAAAPDPDPATDKETEMPYLHGKFVWFEHLSRDIEAARRFYGELLGWKSDPVPIGDGRYHMIMNGADGIGGFRTAMPGMPSHWMSYLSVADVDAAAAAAQQAGGKVLMPPTDFAPVGIAATIADPQGAVFSVWKDAQGDREDRRPIAMGDWYWNELTTTDDQAAAAFYQNVFGYARQEMDMGPQGTYTILAKDDVQRAGLMKNPQPGMPPAWTPYLRVPDCDAAATKAAGLGAQVCVPPTDIPGVGRFAFLVDPTGVPIGIMRGDI